MQEKLEAIKQRVMNGLKPYQRKTVEHVANLFENKHANRVLVADEVGLGKTLVARGVVASTAVIRKREGDKLFKVVYICSNATIIDQNLNKLNVDAKTVHKMDAMESRLSMQHLVAYEKERDSCEDEDCYIQLIPLTPGTSFNMTSGTGTIQERALIYAILKQLDDFKDEEGTQQLKIALQGYAGDKSWERLIEGERLTEEGQNHEKPYYEKRIEEAGADYLTGINSKLHDYRADLQYIKERVDRVKTPGDTAAAECITRARALFARISVEQLDPDLVIMDEFQRFHSIMEEDESTEMGMLVKHFFAGDNRNGNPVRVLLLSATPFKAYSTAAEDDAFFGSESQDDFLRVVDFLSDDDTNRRAFVADWDRYSAELGKAAAKRTDIESPSFKDAKQAAENGLSQRMARTERTALPEYHDIIRESVERVPADEEDIASYLIAQKLFNDFGVSQPFPADYSESCPFPLSYLKGYGLDEKLKSAVRKQRTRFKLQRCDGPKARRLWLSREDVKGYRKIKMHNSRFVRLQDDVFATGSKRFDASSLLWVPASMPYYEVVKGPYVGADGFTKTLVFSAWTMVPRMMSTLLSYEDERRSLEARDGGVRKIDCSYFDQEHDSEAESADESKGNASNSGNGTDSVSTLPSGRLRLSAKQTGAAFLLYPSIGLAKLIDCDTLQVGMKLTDLQAILGEKLEEELAEAGIRVDESPRGGADPKLLVRACTTLDAKACGPTHVADFVGEASSLDELKSAKSVLSSWLESATDNEGDPISIPSELLDDLVDMAIASPAVCAARAFLRCNGCKNADAALSAFRFAVAFMRKMNTPASTLAIDGVYQSAKWEGLKGRSHWRHVLDYCVNGNFQAVLDEYVHQIGYDRGSSYLCEELIGEEVSTFRGPSLYTMQSQYEVETLPYFKSIVNGDAKAKPMRMRTEYAAAFMDDEGRGKNTNRRANLRKAFNSPFRPFVLVSTSVGQEGLDFHAYCRRIVHWNLPTNPIDLEQREGRINRYESLAVRQNVARRFGDRCNFTDGDVWKCLFDQAERELCGGEGKGAGLVPHWGLDENPNDLPIERRVYLREFGMDEARYKKMIDTLVRYRAVLGMPRQEELLNVLGSELDEDEIRGLFMNLCPYMRSLRKDASEREDG